MTASELRSLLEQVTKSPKDSVKDDDDLKSFEGWDSLTSVQFVTLLKQKWGVAVGAAELERCKTVSDLMGFIGGDA